MNAPHYERVAVIGVGLIGGSFARAIKAAGACEHVVGVGRDPKNLEVALALGVIDSALTDAAEAVRDADLVLVATPVAQFSGVFAALAPALRSGALVTDAGSTKRDVVSAARAKLGMALAHFVPAHPIAGAEDSGAGAAQADLFVGKRVVLTPLPENAPQDVARVAAVWEACGARVSRMSAEEHDAVFAAVSHLPHLLAFALVHELARRPDAPRLFSHAASGFRDFTRIASSHPEMWRDICLANSDSLLAELEDYLECLARFRTGLEAKDGEALAKLFAEARSARARWLSGAYDT
jgi:prephenate dehydrogenase